MSIMIKGVVSAAALLIAVSAAHSQTDERPKAEGRQQGGEQKQMERGGDKQPDAKPAPAQAGEKRDEKSAQQAPAQEKRDDKSAQQDKRDDNRPQQGQASDGSKTHGLISRNRATSINAARLRAWRQHRCT